MDLIDVECPRCGEAKQVRFYGPCDDCRAVLVGTVKNEAKDLGDIEYEPKMNVVPNQIATKE